MTIQEIQNQILTSDEFVVSELENFLVYYNLKHTLRWGMDNSRKDETESVAEHVYGMHILADYFLPFYPELNNQRVRQLITWHDMAESLVDDMTTKTKTKAHKQAESAAEKTLVEKSAAHIQATLHTLFIEYQTQETVEAQFVKAVDKVEPIFHMYFLAKTTNINKNIFKTKDSGWTMKEYRAHRKQYIEKHPLIWKFDAVMTPVIDASGLFREWA
jgi:putative hydrolase of HD superfamily